MATNLTMQPSPWLRSYGFALPIQNTSLVVQAHGYLGSRPYGPDHRGGVGIAPFALREAR
jgi:hypothetical protein